MGAFSFIAEAGLRVLKGERAAAVGASYQAPFSQQQLDSIKQHIEQLGLDIQNLGVSSGAPGEITLTGDAASKADAEKAALQAGNIQGVAKVDNQISAQEEAPDSKTYEVQKGDTLWKIAHNEYGNGADYPKIVEANQPMIKNADEIYPGQVLRIPQ